MFRIFYNKDRVVKTTAGKAFRRRGESKYEIPLKEVRELEHEKGEVDFEQETVDLKFPADFNANLAIVGARILDPANRNDESIPARAVVGSGPCAKPAVLIALRSAAVHLCARKERLARKRLNVD